MPGLVRRWWRGGRGRGGGGGEVQATDQIRSYRQNLRAGFSHAYSGGLVDPFMATTEFFMDRRRLEGQAASPERQTTSNLALTGIRDLRGSSSEIVPRLRRGGLAKRLTRRRARYG